MINYIERIPVVLKHFEDDVLKKKYLKFQYGTPSNAGNIVSKETEDKLNKMLADWKANESKLLKLWEAKPDLRLLQILVNNKITDAWSNNYLMDESLWLINSAGVKREEVLFYKVTHDKDNNPIKPEVKLLKDINPEVLMTIIQNCKQRSVHITHSYAMAFDELITNHKLKA